MAVNRIEKLLEFLQETPDDLFLKYALAMEYLALNKPDETEKLLLEVLQVDKNHVASYQQLGLLYQNQNADEKAKTMFEKGIEAARLAGNTKAMREMQNELEGLM